jgi:SdpI/YfhL protein family
VTAEDILGPVVIGVLFALVGLAMLVIAVRIRDGKLHRNRWMGMRTSTTMRSEEAWDAAQRATLPSLWITGPVLLVLGAVDIAVGYVGGHDRLATGVSVVAIVVVILMAVYQMVKGTAAANAADPD